MNIYILRKPKSSWTTTVKSSYLNYGKTEINYGRMEIWNV